MSKPCGLCRDEDLYAHPDCMWCRCPCHTITDERREIPHPVLVVIESPYAGDLTENLAYARRALLDSLRRGEAPIASHLLYTQVLDDRDPVERAQGISAGFAWNRHAEVVAVYIDRGISSGMRAGIKAAETLGIPVTYRSIGEAV